LPYLLHALVEMGRAGIGRQSIPLPVDRIESLGPLGEEAALVCDSRRGFFPERLIRFPAASIPGMAPEVDPDGEDFASPRNVILHLRTPLRMKEAGRIRGGLSPERLVRAALRRLTAVGEALGQEWPRAWPAILEASRRAVVLRESLRWFDWGRYSMRQGRAMRLGGVRGTVEYGNVPGELIGLLRTAAFLHLGKNTTFGLGAIDLREAT
jgi:hypothetical protein